MGHLDVPLGSIYRILLDLPEKATREELHSILQDENLDTLFNQHIPPDDGQYPIRGVVLFGLAEMERARLFADAMKIDRMEFIGQLMNASHDGDRVTTFDPEGKMVEYWALTSNDYLMGLIDDLESGDLERIDRAQLHWQPGSYHCSLPEIDHMVEISLATEGVAGAQLAGAGLGGCMMVLVHRDAVPRLVKALTKQYYTPQGKVPSILVCRPVAGSGILFGDIN